jgi:hypothetical protein
MNDSPLNPVDFFNELGSLHDCIMEQLFWDSAAREITINVDDLNANFDGLPEYQGKKAASIQFKGVQNIQWNCDAAKGDLQRIYKLKMYKIDKSENYGLMLHISPSGQLSFDCQSVRILERNE